MRYFARSAIAAAVSLSSSACSTILGIDDLPGLPPDGGGVGAAGGSSSSGTGGFGGGPSSASSGGSSGSVCVSVDPGTSKRVFVTSQTYAADLTNLFTAGDPIANAATECSLLASQAGLPTVTWKPWLSDGLGTPSGAAFVKSTTPYVLVTGEVVAADYVTLTGTAMQLEHAIHRDECGNDRTDAFAWTGTNADGTINDARCNDWSVNTGVSVGTVGSTSETTSGWSNYAPQSCSEVRRLYCFEQ